MGRLLVFNETPAITNTNGVADIEFAGDGGPSIVFTITAGASTQVSCMGQFAGPEENITINAVSGQRIGCEGRASHICANILASLQHVYWPAPMLAVL